MDDRRYNVVFKGEIHEQATLSLVQERLASIFKADMENIKVMFSKKRTIVKKNAPYEMCQKVEQGFLNAGAFVDIEEVIPEGYSLEAMEQPSESEPEYTEEPNYPQDQEYTQEAEPQYVAEQEEYVEEPNYAQEPEAEYEAEPIPEPAPEPEPVKEPEPDIIKAPGEKKAPPLQMVNESQNSETEPESESEKVDITPEEFEIEPEKEIEEPDRAYGPPPDYKPEDVAKSLEMDAEPEDSDLEPEEEVDELTLGYAPLSEYDSELEPEFEIVEDESEFEIVGVEPDIEPEIDDDFEFDNIEPVETDEFEIESVEPEEFEIEPEEEIEENPYAAPQANLEQEDLSLGDFVYPQKRPFKNGFRWIVSGFNLFKQAKLTWIVSVFVFMLISTIAGLIPFLGAIVSNIFNPVFLAGFIIGAKEQDEGGKLKIGHVFAGFSSNFGQLILFGLAYFVTILLVFGFIGVVFILIFVAGGLGSMNFADPSSIAALSNMSPLVFLILILVGMLITVPIMMAYYFGPALISVNQVTIFEAVKMSFKGCLRNMLPFFLYGLTCTVLFILIMGVFIGIAVLVGMLLEEAGMIVGAIGMMIIIFTITPIFIASTYAAYKDIFYAE